MVNGLRRCDTVDCCLVCTHTHTGRDRDTERGPVIVTLRETGDHCANWHDAARCVVEVGLEN